MSALSTVANQIAVAGRAASADYFVVNGWVFRGELTPPEPATPLPCQDAHHPPGLQLQTNTIAPGAEESIMVATHALPPTPVASIVPITPVDHSRAPLLERLWREREQITAPFTT